MKKHNFGGAHPDNSFQRARVKAGYSQETASEALNCGARSLQGYEAGRCNPPSKILMKMKELYNCEFSDLHPDNDDEKPPPDGPDGKIKASKSTSDFLSKGYNYRTPMRVSSMRSYHDARYGVTTYPVCPQCASTIEREYQNFCDRCGQALDWKQYAHALIINSDSDTH